MRRSVVRGSVVGIVLGAIVTFALAHGGFRSDTGSADAAQRVRADALEAPRDAGPMEVLPLRPLRPGSAPSSAAGPSSQS